jgi:hypothetical protein
MVLPAKQDEIADPILKGFAVRILDAVIRCFVVYLQIGGDVAERA